MMNGRMPPGPEWRAAQAFDLGGRVRAARPHGRGLINDSFVVDLDGGAGRALLQRINRRVFPQPELIMQNLRVLSDHLRRRAAPGGRRALRLPAIFTTHEGKDFFVDADGDFWRALEFIADTRTLENLADPAQAGEVGRALGRFHADTRDLDPARLHLTRPGFHDTPRYLARLDRVVRAGRAASGAEPEALAFVAARRASAGALEDAKAAGRIAPRVIHGDPKLDNFLFDAGGARVVSLIDLDTVQPGLIHYDLGDCLRSCCNPAGESPPELAAVRFDLDLCRALLTAYAAEAGEALAAADRAPLYDAVRLIPFELGVRFLTDHLEGDVYFKVERPGHNLYRAQAQFRLTAEIERREGAIRELIESLAGG
jgi:Ser/Thr protein kinase RdoA (MazF antagonist)